MGKHEECEKKGWSGSVEFKKMLDYEQGDNGFVNILFEEVCQECGEKVGEEIQHFKYSHSKEV